jgi:hypothetical protein
MASQLTREIPHFGTATFRIPGFGLVMDLRELADEAEEPNHAALFTSRVVAAMLVEPEMTPEELEKLPSDSFTALIEAAADVLDIHEHYAGTSPRLPAQIRFYEAYVEQERELVESLNAATRQYTTGLKDTLDGLFLEVVQSAGLTAQITEHIPRLSVPVPVIDFSLPSIDASSWAGAFDISQSIAELVGPLIEAPTTLAEQMGEMLGGLSDAVARVSANLAAATIAAEESALLGLFDNLMALVQPHLDAADAFKAAGWPIGPSMPSELIEHIVTMHRQGKTQYISRTIMGHYQRSGHENLRTTVASWKADHLLAPRMHILTDALEAHCQGLYTLSVPAVIPQIEGVLNDYVLTNNLDAKLGKVKQVYEAVIGDVEQYPLSHWVIAGTLLYQLETSTYDPTDFRTELRKSINTRRVTRHTVAHGVALKYDKPIHSLRAFVLLDAVSALQEL